jgi:glycine cleavage system H protein
MSDVLETTVDKFIFRVPTDRRYTAAGVWVLSEGDRLRVGVTDFVQQRSGDVAFAEVRGEGTVLEAGDELALIETIKANLEVAAPVAGTVAVVNPALLRTPELVNQDPYGAGWLALVDPRPPSVGPGELLEPEAYFALMRAQAEEEARQP